MRKIFILGIVLILSLSAFLGCKPQAKVKVKGEKVKKEEVKGEKVEKSKAAERKEITLYFGDYQSFSLLPEKRKISQVEAVAQAAVEELIKGPREEGHFSTIPPGTKVLGISVEDDLAEVDFSEEFVKNHPGGSAAERLTVYSIVDTLTEFPTIRKVKFLINGEPIETLTGHLDLTELLERDEEIIRKK